MAADIISLIENIVIAFFNVLKHDYYFNIL